MGNKQNIANAMNGIEKSILSTIKDLEPQTTKIVKEQIQDVVNAAYTPVIYERKFYLENSLQANTTPVSGGSVILIDHDESLMHYTDAFTGDEVSDQQEVPYMIESGTIPAHWGEGFAYLKARPYMEKSRIFLEGVIGKLFGASFKKYS